MKMSLSAGVLAALATTSAALGQEAMYTAAATMPSPGVFVFRQQAHYWAYGADPVSGAKSVQEVELMNTLQYGLARDWSLTIDVPLEIKMPERRSGVVDTLTGIDEVDLTVKWRIYQSDTGGVDTQRLALMAGARLRTEDQFGVDPHIGAVWTQVFGRHGVNFEVHYIFNTLSKAREFNFGGDGADDALALNAAYVFRVIPEAYTSESQAAWYLTNEINTLYESNGDWEVRYSPGLMWEGRRWGFEIMGQVPVYQRVRGRSELDWGIGAGFRILF